MTTMTRLESEIPIGASTGEMVCDAQGRLTRIGLNTPDPHIAGVCQECGKVMEYGWDTVCFACHKVLCYDHSHEAAGHWLCAEDFREWKGGNV